MRHDPLPGRPGETVRNTARRPCVNRPLIGGRQVYGPLCRVLDQTDLRVDHGPQDLRLAGERRHRHIASGRPRRNTRVDIHGITEPGPGHIPAVGQSVVVSARRPVDLDRVIHRAQFPGRLVITGHGLELSEHFWIQNPGHGALEFRYRQPRPDRIVPFGIGQR
ncbi:MAG: hypothetical protein BWY49_00058 [Candidatus Omnitrophica bacterium ADurb.Bin314]|nr:MAG: hypothetical protein BWY49_00058 [Candidatus Omnitrophica bacterium ADurb.Bin314]